ncbi:lipopolysaccharide biosynthesis protein [Sphingobacterium faecium]|nr:lipopolysaccharide biosynthesis protein [Sphingobacterium faecium]
MTMKEPIQDEMTLKQLLRNIHRKISYLMSRWYILLILAIIGGGLGYFYGIVQKPIYTATTTFVLESSEGEGVSKFSGIASMVGIDMGNSSGGLFQQDNLLEFYKSRKMLEASLLKNSPSDSTKLMIDKYLEMVNQGQKTSVEKIDFSSNKLPVPLKRERDSVLMKVIKDIGKYNLKVDKVDKKLSILKIDFISTDEVFSKEFNEVLVDEVNEFYIDTKTKKSLRNIEILEYKADSVRAIMNGSIASAAMAIDMTPNLNPTRQAQRLIPSQRSQFSVESNKVILGQILQHLEIAKMTLLQESPLIQIVDQPTYPLDKKIASKSKLAIIGSGLAIVLGIIGLIILQFIRAVLKN